jgi:hypothetical protein
MVARLFENLVPPALRGAGGLARALVALPFAAAIALIFGQQLFRLWKAFGLGVLSLQDVSFIQKQYDFLLNCRYLLNAFDIAACKSKMIGQLNPFDFELFEMFFWIALALVILRVVSGAVALPSLETRYCLPLQIPPGIRCISAMRMMSWRSPSRTGISAIKPT